MHRRVDRDALERDQAHVAAVAGLDVPCAGCAHELGFHRFTTFNLPTPCGVLGCDCSTFQEAPPMLDPFHDFGEPPEPDVPPMTSAADLARDFLAGEPEPDAQNESEQVAQDSRLDAFSAPVGVAVADVAVTVVSFPVVAAGAAGVDLAALEEPARRVAEIVEAIQPVLVPPPLVRELEALVAKANALEVTDAASYATGCELYELLAANEKGIEQTIGPVVGFFHRPWKAMCDFRAKFAPPVLVAKRRLSDVCGAWKQAENDRAERQRKIDEEAAAADERRRLEAVAAEAKKQGQLEVAETATQMAKTVEKPALPSRSTVPTGVPTKGRTKWVHEVLDLQKIYQGIADGTIPQAAAPLDTAWWDRQAHDLKGELEKRYPGAKAVEKNGLSASGRR